MPPILSKADKAIKRKIYNAANSIRKKYLSLKLERDENDEAISKLLNPIKEPLTKLVKNVNLTNIKMGQIKLEDQVKSEMNQVKPEMNQEKPIIKQHEVKFQPTKVLVESNDGEDDDEAVFNLIQQQENEQELQKSIDEYSHSYQEYLNQYPQIAQKYVDLYYTNPSKIDTTYGLSHEKEIDLWKIGNERLDFLSSSDIKIGGVIYKGTAGLYELIFLKMPKTYPTRFDQQQYKAILDQTSVHKRDFNPLGQVKGSNSTKYKQFIQPIISSNSTAAKLHKQRIASEGGQRSPTYKSAKFHKHQVTSEGGQRSPAYGSALLNYNDKPKEYVYFDDVNELVDRLIKLDASQTAGNNNHANEIVSILEELTELGVIERI